MEHQQIHCLLIDDDADEHEIFAMAMEDFGSSVKCFYANGGLEGLEKLNSPDFHTDFIFLDLNMPRMNGKECLAEIKRINRWINVPLYIYSTSSDYRIKEEVLVMGATGYIVKPAIVSELTKILAGILLEQKSVIEG